MQEPLEQMEYSTPEWNDFYKNNNVFVPYLDVCVFAVKKLGGLPKSSTIFEFGYGIGNNLKFIRGVFADVRLLGCDISPVAVQKLKSERITNSEFWVNGSELKIVENDIALVIERGAIQHVSKGQAQNYIDEIYRSMKVGGRDFLRSPPPLMDYSVNSEHLAMMNALVSELSIRLTKLINCSRNLRSKEYIT